MQQRKLRHVPGAPTIYLIDEYHHCDKCTDDNIVIAKDLFNAGVVLAGVEGYEGGLRYDDYDRQYMTVRSNAKISDSTLIGSYPRFAQSLESAGLLVVGVDCRGLANTIETDIVDGRWEQDQINNHPNNLERSMHFIRTLVEEFHARGLNGDLLLNCGSNHNTHIEKALSGNVVLPKEWPDWNYIRVRSPYFVECGELGVSAKRHGN